LRKGIQMAKAPRKFKHRFKDSRKDQEHKRKKRFDRTRPTSTQRGYDWSWRKASQAYRKANPVCVYCRDKGLVSPAQEVDHIKPHKGIQELFWDESNWQSLCKPCHSRKTAGECSFAGGGCSISGAFHALTALPAFFSRIHINISGIPMGKRGAKPKPKKLKVLQNTNRPCREAEVLAEALPGNPVKPNDLTNEASLIWDAESAKLLARGIDLGGYEVSFKTFCELTAKINKHFFCDFDVPGAWLTEQRRLCNEFHMTPASGLGKNGSGKKDNPYSKFGKKSG